MTDEAQDSGGGDKASETKALSMGWVPKEKFRGDEAKWVDAKTFVDRGEHFLPILQANNRRLQEDNQRTVQEVKRLESLLVASSESIEELKKFHEADTRAKVEQQREKLLRELKKAKADDDVDAEVEITDQLTRVNATLQKEEKREEKAPTKKDDAPPDLDPAFLSWQSQPENAWFGKDRERTEEAIAVAQYFRAKGDRTTGAAFYEKVAERVAENLGDKPRQPADKVGGGRNSGGGGDTGGGKSFKDLPADAKAVCETQATKLVGEGRAFKTKAEWQSHYAEQFFKDY